MIKALFKKFSTLFILILTLSACGGGSSSNPEPPPPPPPPPPDIVVDGGGVKGPLANAIVTVYAIDASQAGFKGAVVATASTDNSSAITGLALPFPVAPPYILELSSDSGTTDITTGLAPVITTLSTLITQSLLDGGEQIYASPLTTMALQIAVLNSNATTSNAEFEAASKTAAIQVVSTLGFGMSGEIDIFDLPPLIDSTTTTTEIQTAVAAYRTAVEALTAIVFQMAQQSPANSVDDVFNELANDLADGVIDGVIAGSASQIFTSTSLDILAQDPSTLPIPNSLTNQTVADVQAILVSETTTTGSNTSTTELDTGGTITTMPEPAETNTDSDGDGVLNSEDAFPNDSSETVDSDGDGIGDNADPDDDNDGILDEDEGVTPVVTAQDGDGDGHNDGVDNCPTNFNPAQTNTDGQADGGDACDDDDDDDGAADGVDLFPLDATEQADADTDGIGNNADTDDDNDGLDDATEDSSGASIDHDTDGTPNREDIDSDNDGVLDSVDFDPYDDTVTFNNAPITVNSSATTDEDVAVAVVLSVSDDGVALGALVFNIVDPTNGTLFGTEPNLTYTPNAEFSGSDSFTFFATDSGGKQSNTSTVSITVTAVNDAPVIEQSDPLVVVMDEDGSPIAFVAPTITATDIDSTSLNWTGSTATNGVASVSGTGISPTVTYVPNAGFSGSDSFDVIVTDDNGASDSIAINITIGAQNDAPVIAQIGPLAVSMDEDGMPTAFVAPTITATDVDSGTLTWTGSAATNGVASVSGVGASPAISYSPNANFAGVDSFVVSVSDGSGGSDSITINVTINSQNDAPIIAQTGPLVVVMDEDGSPTAFVAPTITATDAEGNTLTWTGSAATNGTATVTGMGANPTIGYTPNADFNGIDSFNVSVNDGNGGSATIAITITITAQNDLPTIGGTPATTATDGIAYNFTPTANDVDGEALSFTIQNKPSWATFNVSDGNLSGTPATADVGGNFTNIIISVTAASDTVALAPFSITVNPPGTQDAVWDEFNWDDGSPWQ